MISPNDQQRGLLGWGISILFHLGLLLAGTLVLFHPVQFKVEQAVSSTEVEFAAQPTPAPVVTPPTPTPTPPAPEPTPTPPVQPSPVPEIAEPITPTPEPAAAPSPPVAAAVPAKTQTRKPPTTQKASPAPVTSRASRGAIDAQPDELHNAPPEYPEAARVAHEEGTVILRVEVSAGGTPTHVSIQQSSGYSQLDRAAREAIEHWKFHPALVAGMPVSSEADVPVHFKLEQ